MTHAPARSIAALLLALLLSPQALAAGSAEDLLEEAVKRYGLADFEGALELLNTAQHRTKDTRVLARIHVYQGLNYGELDRLPLSRAAFTTALTFDPDICPDPAQYKEKLVKLCREVREGLRGTLAISSEPEGAEVSVDGKQVGRTPLELRLTIGVHLVLIRGPDGQRKRHEVTVFPDKTARVSSVLDAAPPPASAPVEPPPPPRRGRLWTWIAAGGAVVAAAVGAGVWASAESDYGEWEKIADLPATTPSEEQRLDELEDAVKRKEVAAWVMFGTAGALAVTSVALFFLEGRPTDEKPGSSRVQLAPLLGPAPGASLRVSF